MRIQKEPEPWTVGAFALGLMMLLTGGGAFFSNDAWATFQTASALLETGSPALSPSVKLLETHTLRIPGPLIASPHGALYAKYNLGHPLLALPLMKAAHRLAHWIPGDSLADVAVLRLGFVMLPAIATACGAALLYALARSMWGAAPALWISALWLLATPAGPYGKFPYSEALLAALWLLAYASIFWNSQRPTSAGWFLSGLACGWAIFVREASAAGLPAVILYLCLRTPSGRARLQAAAIYGLGLSLPVMAAAGYNFWRFGVPLQTGYYAELQRIGLSLPSALHLYALLVSPGKGLLLYAPPLLTAIGGWASAWRVHRSEILAIGLHALSFLLFYSSWYSWHGGWSWGPRFLVPLLPLLMIGLGKIVLTRRGRKAALLLGCLGFFIQIPGFAVDFQEYYMDLLKERGATYEEDLIFQPSLSPILGEWRMLIRGEYLTMGFLSLERYGIPAPIAWGYRAATLILLIASAVRIMGCLPPSDSPHGLQWSRPQLYLLQAGIGGVSVLTIGLNVWIWWNGMAQHQQPLCDYEDRRCLQARFTDGIELVAFSYSGRTVRPGERFRMILWWRAGRPVPEPYSVYVHFMRNGDLVFQDDHEHPAFLPLPEWTPGWIYPDPHEVQVPQGISPGEYIIRVGLYRRHPPGGRIPTQDGRDGIELPVTLQISP